MARVLMFYDVTDDLIEVIEANKSHRQIEVNTCPKIVAVAARDLERCQAFAKRYSIPKAYDSYEQLANDKDVEIVYIGTLHTEHLRLCLMMLNAGKHLLCEKPATLNRKQLQQILDKAKEKNLFFMEAIKTRFHPGVLDVMKELSKDVIGEVKMINVIQCAPVAHIPRLHLKELGGGGLIDIGIYGLALVNMIFKGRPEKITATGHLMDTGVDDTIVVTLLYPGGHIATVSVCTQTAPLFKAYIQGPKGTIQASPVPPEVIYPSGTVKYPDPPGPTHLPAPEPLPWNPNPTLDGMTGFIYEADVARECIMKGQTEHPSMSHEDSVILKDIMDEARRQVGVVYDADLQ